MEKFFIITEQSELRQDYFEYKENTKVIHNLAKDFMNKHGIEAEYYHASEELFYIIPTKKDEESFNNVLGKELDNGLRPFKINSKINKDWLNILKEKNLKVLSKPYLAFYIKNVYGKHSTRLFDIDNILYCSFSYPFNFEVPEGFTEIKASEFYKLIEDYNESVKGEE